MVLASNEEHLHQNRRGVMLGAQKLAERDFLAWAIDHYQVELLIFVTKGLFIIIVVKE